MPPTEPIISVQNISKRYRLGQIGATTLRESAERLWHRMRGRDPEMHMGTVGTSGVGASHSENVEHGSGKALRSGSIWALRDVSLEVKRGEVLGIIGKNGAGKSTLLKVLSRITEPTKGRALLHGRVGSLLEVGTGFHPELTGRENIYLNGAILGMKKREIDVKFDEIISFAEIEKFVETPVKRYSSGMYVRLAFAVAAHLDPEILLVDEVLAVGDAAFQRKCLGKMRNVAAEGRTVLFVSHNMGAITRLCGRAIWIDAGKLIADGPSRRIVDDYLDRAAAGATSHQDLGARDSGGILIEEVVLRNSTGEQTTSYRPQEDIIVEIRYNAPRRIEKPYFWVSVASQYGHLFAANMLFDDLRPEYIEGRGAISCVFKGVRLLPQTYSVSLGARYPDGRHSLLPTITDVAAFRIVTDAHGLRMTGELADLFIEKATPMQVPYQWHFDDGSIHVPDWVEDDSSGRGRQPD